MPGCDLAEIHGYETKNFNRLVRNNINKFDEEDFMLQLTKVDVEHLSRCRKFTLNRAPAGVVTCISGKEFKT